MSSKQDGVIVEYVFKTQRDLNKISQVKFVNNQLACEWLTEAWPLIATRSEGRLVRIQTDAYVYYPEPDILFKDSPHVPDQLD
jgi:hypothetical protein